MQDEETKERHPAKPRKRRRWLRRLAILLVALAAFLVWLNGPGIRWLGPKIARHFLSRAGFEGSFELAGSLLGGLSIREIDLAGNAQLSVVQAGSIKPLYKIRDLLKGKVDGIEIDGLHIELQLETDAELQEETTGPAGPPDLARIVAAIRAARQRVLPASIHVDDLSLKILTGENRLLELAPSDITHEAGSGTFRIDLGAITDATGREWPAQSSGLIWNADSIELDRLNPLPGIGVRDLRVATPEAGEPSAELDLLVDEAVFDVAASPGFSNAVVQLREGRVASGVLLERFGVDVPASAELVSFSAAIDGILPAPKDATGEVRLTLENIASGEWAVPELSLDAALGPAEATVAARAMALGSELTLDARAPVSRGGGKLLLGNARGGLRVAEVPEVVAALAEKSDAIRKDAEVPASHIAGSFAVDFDNNQPAGADATLTLQPEDPEIATPVTVRALWKPDAPLVADLRLDGLDAHAEADLPHTVYQATASLDGFDSGRVVSWLRIVGVDPGGTLRATATLRGEGNWSEMRHEGRLELPSATFSRPAATDIQAAANATYQWPGTVTLDALKVRAGPQEISTNLRLADAWIELDDLQWREGEKPLASGNARLPVPGDLAKWRETLARDERPITADLRTETLALRSLSDWIPALATMDGDATGQAHVKISGTYPDPAIDATVELRNLRVPDRPDLPPADLKLTIGAKENHLGVVGNLATPDLEPAVITASLPFRPAEWAETPDSIRAEPLTARADLPRITLGRFQTLAPAVETLAGVLTGNVEVAGTLGEPDIRGHLELNEAAVTLEGDKVPPIRNAGLAVDFDPGRVELKNLRATIAGGTLSGGGTLALDEWKPGETDIRITGRQLPIVRNESTIVRANADLRLAGTFENAVLSGTIGVLDSLYYQDIELIPIGVPFTGPSAASLPKIDPPDDKTAGIPEPFRNWRLDLRARTLEPFLIRGNLATGEVEADIGVGGTIGDPAPDGYARLRNVTASLPFTTLRVREGWIRFTPESGLDPLLEIRGTANPKPYRVTAYVYGKASDPQIVLTSSPPLPENEIMTLLATGTTTSGLEDPQMASSRAIQLLIEEIRRGRLGGSERLRPLLKVLDRVEFTLTDKNPYTSETYTSATIALTDRWFLAASMGEEGNTRLMGIWRLTFR